MAKVAKKETKKSTKKQLFVKNKKSSTLLRWIYYIVLCIAAGFIGWKLGNFYADWEKSRKENNPPKEVQKEEKITTDENNEKKTK